MADQRFTNAFREALWKAQGERCIYCARPIAFIEMKIDHVIPECLSGDKERLKIALDRVGENPEFDVLGYDNLALSCDPCNQKKRDLPLADRALMIVLAEVKTHVGKLRELLEQRRRERDLDSTLRHIARSYEANRFTDEELLRGLDLLKKMPNGVRGASPSAPPASPEDLRGGMYFRDENRILWSPEAINDMQYIGLNANELNDLLYKSVQSHSLIVTKMSPDDGVYCLRVGNNVRLFFKPKSNGTSVLRVLTRTALDY